MFLALGHVRVCKLVKLLIICVNFRA